MDRLLGFGTPGGGSAWGRGA
ncbi:unnamed protein product [Gulo gulo]|uniref:Uncharacterized protein n=1 Tax=Gulo gulo TaxID=48420 RepID=A0A9X9MC23_GULGU|nr:unnamed protein product [Gulo gulo]